MATNRLGSAGHNGRVGYQSLLPHQPAPFLRTLEGQAKGFGFSRKSRSGMVPVRFMAIPLELRRSLHGDGSGLPRFRPVRPKARSSFVVSAGVRDSADDHDGRLEKNRRILATLRSNLLCFRTPALATGRAFDVDSIANRYA